MRRNALPSQAVRGSIVRLADCAAHREPFMRIINPCFGQAVATGETIKAGAVDWRRDPIVLFSNSKPNAKELLEGLKAKLGSIRAVDTIDLVWKPSASQPASPDLLDKVAHKYRAALLALGD
jgi:hypothetical protein